MFPRRDFLEAAPSPAGTLSTTELAGLMSDQTNVLADIRRELMKAHPDVLTTTVVQGGLNTIATADHSYRVWFEVGGKPVPIYALLAYCTVAGTTPLCALSVVSMSKLMDGIPFAYKDLLYKPVSLSEVYVMAPVNAIINGPAANADTGSFYIYGFTIPDYDRNKGNLR